MRKIRKIKRSTYLSPENLISGEFVNKDIKEDVAENYAPNAGIINKINLRQRYANQWDMPKKDLIKSMEIFTRPRRAEAIGNHRDSLYNEILNSPKLEIKDHRTVDYATGAPLGDNARMHSTPPQALVQSIIKASLAEGVDPYTVLAMGIQESNLDFGKYYHNIFMLSQDNYEKAIPYTGDSVLKATNDNIMRGIVRLVKDKHQYAKNLGKQSEEEILQSWNGYGTIGPDRYQNLYGVKTPIDFNKNPIYGKRIIDIRDNIIKTNPTIKSMVEEAMNAVK